MLSNIRIQYRDDENTFVNLTCQDDLMDAYRCLRPVQNSEDLYRLCLRVHGSATPVPQHAVGQLTNRPKRRFALPPKQLNFLENMSSPTTNKSNCMPENSESKTFKSPLEVFLHEKGKAVDFQEQRVAQWQAAMMESESAFVGPTGSFGKFTKTCLHKLSFGRPQQAALRIWAVPLASFCNLLEKHPNE